MEPKAMKLYLLGGVDYTHSIGFCQITSLLIWLKLNFSLLCYHTFAAHFFTVRKSVVGCAGLNTINITDLCCNICFSYISTTCIKYFSVVYSHFIAFILVGCCQ